MMNFNDVEGKHLGGGVVLFENAASVDWDWMYKFCERSIEQEKAEMYSLTTHPNTGEEVYVNNSGYYFPIDTIEEMPYRATRIHRDKELQAMKTLAFIDEVKYKCLLKYIEMFPLVYKCVWWQSRGHITQYKSNVYMGPHADIQTDYMYGVPHPSQQLAMKNVVGTIFYINDSVKSESELNGKNFTGGSHYFPYLDIEYTPKRGDVLMFPSDYMAAHQVKPTGGGVRYAYLGWYCHGSPNKELNENVLDPLEDPANSTMAVNVYLPFLRQDYLKQIEGKGYKEESMQYLVALNMEQY
jgi:hypothetical protein